MRPDILTKNSLERYELPIAVQKGLGETACSGCPLLVKNVCPGKASAEQECPPESAVIKIEEIQKALMDDSVASITAGEGGFYALPNKIKHTVTPQAKEVPKVYAPLPQHKTIAERVRSKHSVRTTAKFGELAADLVMAFVKWDDPKPKK